MSRLAKNAIPLPSGVQVTLNGQEVTVKGAKGQLTTIIHELYTLEIADNSVLVKLHEKLPTKVDQKAKRAFAGTTWALVRNMIQGVSEGFEKRLILKGVGYRANMQGKDLNLNLGFSHPTIYKVPVGIEIEVVSSQTEIVIRGIDKQKVGQVAAEIRSIRPVEPYKGKGIRYSDEEVILKETKKK